MKVGIFLLSLCVKMKPAMEEKIIGEEPRKRNFLEEIIEADLASGKMDDLAFYTIALDGGQVSKLFNDQK